MRFETHLLLGRPWVRVKRMSSVCLCVCSLVPHALLSVYMCVCVTCLQNNLNEYLTMINWVRTADKIDQKYYKENLVWPIEEGR